MKEDTGLWTCKHSQFLPKGWSGNTT